MDVSGKHNAIYEAYYKQMDPHGKGIIEAMDAARFLKKSTLSDVVLSRIWDLSDPNGRGHLDKKGFFTALKLVALAQAGETINIKNIHMETQNPPKVGDLPKIIQPSIQTVSPAATDWSIKPADRLKYEKLFDSLQPVEGLIPGNKVKGVLMDSKLPLETLGKIWDLADQDRDGSLDKHEFIVAMHLVYQALDKKAIPTELPAELLRPKASSSSSDFVAEFPAEMAPPPVPPLPVAIPSAIPPVSRIPPVIPPLPTQMPLIPQATPLLITDDSDWVVTPHEKLRYDQIFASSDKDKDGLVSGGEIKDVFLQSGLPQLRLAHIWSLCDTKQLGKLTSDQFALAMWFVERAKRGVDPPEVLAPNMIPPSLRTKADSADILLLDPEPAQPAYTNPELELISKEIEELARERRVLENDIAQKEADIRIKSGEVRSLQCELDTLTATLKQLENQKGEAQKRLDDLKAQKSDVDDALHKVNQDISETRFKVNKIREQCQKQEDTINEQESELNQKRSELQKLKDEEMALEREYDSNRNELDNLTKQLQSTQFNISQVKAMVTRLLEKQRAMNDALILCRAAIEENNPTLVSDYSLKLEPDFREAKQTLEAKESPKSDPFNDKSDKFSGNGFGSSEFKPSGFSSSHRTFDDDNFTSSGGFDDSFNTSFPTTNYASNTGNDPFGDSKSAAVANAVTPDPNKDDFGSDPFAILHAPTSANQIPSPGSLKSGPPPRPESPSPALPPKKQKQPPPRPAPPRPLQTPNKGFADFADFDNKANTLNDFTEDPFKDMNSFEKDPFKSNDFSFDASDAVFLDEFPENDNIFNTAAENKSNTNSPFKQNTQSNVDFDAFDRLCENYAKTNNNARNDFFDAFNDNVAKQSTNSTSAFDAFGDNKIINQTTNDTKNHNIFDAFNQFDDEFSKMTITPTSPVLPKVNNVTKQNQSLSLKTNKEQSKEFNANFANFDTNFNTAFGFVPSTKVTKKQRNLDAAFPEKSNDAKALDKFTSDYSKTETFEEDLQEILKRSIVEQ